MSARTLPPMAPRCTCWCAASRCPPAWCRCRSSRLAMPAEPSSAQMANPPSALRYTKEHEWVRLDGDIATVGITDHAQKQLGDVVFVELPEIGRDVSADEACAVVESVKAASDIYAPLAGKVVETNQTIIDDPSIVNSDAEGEGWFFRIEIDDTDAYDALMDAA